jgi:hypothetical protein
MPEPSGATSPFALPYSLETDKVDPPRDLKALAEAVNKMPAYNLVASAINVAAVSRELVQATAAITVTSPAAAVNASFGVLANGHVVRIEAATGKFYGDSVEGAAAIEIAGYQHVIIQSDGVNWFIVSGQVGGRSWGFITAGGGINGGSGDYTVANDGAGGYTITWNKAKPSQWYAVTANLAGAAGNLGYYITVGEVQTTFFKIKTNKNASGEPWAFHFHVMF